MLGDVLVDTTQSSSHLKIVPTFKDKYQLYKVTFAMFILLLVIGMMSYDL